MKAKLATLWEALRSSFWFVPALMVILAMLLAFVTVTLDERVGTERIAKLGWLYTGGPEGARALLATVAGSMLTVAGVTFSITIAALTLASSQFGPRLLRNFTRDLGNQIVLGAFIAAFIYSLLVLRTIRGGDTGGFVPNIAVTVGVGLALAGVGVLIYFIDHVAQSIQVSHLIGVVGADLDEAIDRLFPEEIGGAPPKPARRQTEHDIPADFEHEARPVKASKSGYIQAVDDDSLMQLATDQDVLLRLRRRPGDYVVAGTPLVAVWPGNRVGRELARRVDDAFVLGQRRTPTEDVEFAANQLVEIAVRAISPAINDPFTAITCIDRLGNALRRLAGREPPSPYRYDQGNRLRVIAEPVTFTRLTDVAFNQIRQYGQSSAAVTIRLLETIAEIAPYLRAPEQRAALRRQALMIERGSHDGLPEEQDRRDVAQRCREALQALDTPGLGNGG
jgi:uncharacterized membrane protein